MERVDPLRKSWPLHSPAATRRIEQSALASLPPHALMRRAGHAVARLALAVAPHARRIRVVAGPGNNGGDGLEAAVHLVAAGKRVEVHLLGAAGAPPADAADALARACQAGVHVAPSLGDLHGDEGLVIDALLGIGANRAPEGEVAAAIAAMRANAIPVLAVDVPSGLHPLTGQPLGDAAVRASRTLSLLTLKPGLFTGAGRDHAGEVWFDDLGIDSAGEPSAATLGGGALLAGRTARLHAQHKGSFGNVHVVGGARGMVGAALLAARAALAAGAGRVYVHPLDGGSLPADPTTPELMVRADGWRGEDAQRDGVVVCGCGAGDAVRAALPSVLSRAARLVLDADALNAIAADPSLQRLLRARGERGAACVLTPHPLEAARLLGCRADQVQADRLDAAVRLARMSGAVVVLKGSGTVVAAEGHVPSINPTGNAALATAGTGDVLAGWVGGRWAQETDPSLDAARAVTVRSVFVHGLAAHGVAAPLQASRLIERMQALG